MTDTMGVCGFCAIVGRPSSGKSTLMNALCGHKVSIVAPSPQTTRNRVRGIVNEERGQIIFVDTPGFYLNRSRYSMRLRGVASYGMRESDLLLYIIDSTRTWGDEEEAIQEAVCAAHRPVIIAVNKVDRGTPPPRLHAAISALFPDASVIEISALRQEGLERLKDAIFRLLPTQTPLYPHDQYTDQPPGFRVSEIVREQTILRLGKEVPHSVFVEIVDTVKMEDNHMIRLIIYVERESQKGMVVGKGGTRLHRIREGSIKAIRKIFPYPVSLDIRVKTRPKWKNSERLLEQLIN